MIKMEDSINRKSWRSVESLDIRNRETGSKKLLKELRYM